MYGWIEERASERESERVEERGGGKKVSAGVKLVKVRANMAVSTSDQGVECQRQVDVSLFYSCNVARYCVTRFYILFSFSPAANDPIISPKKGHV